MDWRTPLPRCGYIESPRFAAAIGREAAAKTGKIPGKIEKDSE